MRDSNPQAQRAAVFKTADLPISLILQRARYFKGIAVILQAIIDIVDKLMSWYRLFMVDPLFIMHNFLITFTP